MAAADLPPVPALRDCLLDLQQPVGKRTRAVFYLRTHGGPEAAAVLEQAVRQRADSALMRHELCYVLGQMGVGAHGARGTLLAILRDADDDVVVRHEAAEALCAIDGAGEPSAEVLAALREFCDDPHPEVSDTCRLAVDMIEWRAGKPAGDGETANPYASVDPAPSSAGDAAQAADALGAVLCDEGASLFARYRALFTLRNRGAPEDVLALTQAFARAADADCSQGALLRHEVAYVLGQLEQLAAPAVPALIAVLQDRAEHSMVRHEAAEALGAIGGAIGAIGGLPGAAPSAGEDIAAVLEAFRQDEEQIVRESCDVALDITAYWAGGEGEEGV